VTVTFKQLLLIVTVVASGVWGAAQMIIAGERADNSECTERLNALVERTNAVCDERVTECVITCDGRVETVTLHFDECLNKVLRISSLHSEDEEPI
jgi:hypothetical protein